MKKNSRKPIFILGFVLGIIVSASVAVYALTYYATDVIYKNKTVEEALNELYSKSSAYGVKRAISSSSSAWERTGKSVGLVANAQIGEDEVQNDFDNIYPWSDIITVDLNRNGTENSSYNGTDEWFTNATGEIMTYIPEFYYLRYQKDGYEYVSISEDFIPGYTKSDAFYIGRYTTSTGTHSKSGTKPQDNTKGSNFRSQAVALGSGWQLMDYHYFIIQLLYLVEYADYNSQNILGQGYTNENTKTVVSGGCSELGMKSGTLVNDGKHSVIYRGIEDIYGNIWQFVDGINIKEMKAYVSYTPSKYAVDKFNDSYTEVGYLNASSNEYVSKLGYSTNYPLVSLPTEVSGSATTYLTDYYWQATGNRVALVGGRWNASAQAGLWTWNFNCASSVALEDIGSRLLKTI